MLEQINIQATSINDAWHQLIFRVEQEGRKRRVDQGSFAGQYRYEFDFVLVRISFPWMDMIPIFPPGITIPPPCDMPMVEQYFANYLFGPNRYPNEQYTYGQRLVDFSIDIAVRSGTGTLFGSYEVTANQIQSVIDRYRTGGYGNNQCCMEIAQPTDILLDDPPCLRLIDTRIENGILHFFAYFRSWDLWGGFPVNLGGIELLKQYMAKEIGVENGMLLAASKGLHIYDHCLEYVRMRRG